MKAFAENGAKKVFVGLADWPGFARSGRTEAEAIETLLSYGARYRRIAKDFTPPKTIKVAERHKGDSGTDYGVLGASLEGDGKITPKELGRQIAILKAAWRAFDSAATKHAKTTLTTGPRGGGRTVAKMVDHVDEAEHAYLNELGVKHKRDDIKEIRRLAIDALRKRAGGWEPEKGPRRKRPFWTPRYYIRRSAWHALDHAWEIEDRAVE